MNMIWGAFGGGAQGAPGVLGTKSSQGTPMPQMGLGSAYTPLMTPQVMQSLATPYNFGQMNAGGATGLDSAVTGVTTLGGGDALQPFMPSSAPKDINPAMLMRYMGALNEPDDDLHQQANAYFAANPQAFTKGLGSAFGMSLPIFGTGSASPSDVMVQPTIPVSRPLPTQPTIPVSRPLPTQPSVYDMPSPGPMTQTRRGY